MSVVWIQSITITRAKALYLKEFRLRNGKKVSGNFQSPPSPTSTQLPTFELLALFLQSLALDTFLQLFLFLSHSVI